MIKRRTSDRKVTYRQLDSQFRGAVILEKHLLLSLNLTKQSIRRGTQPDKRIALRTMLSLLAWKAEAEYKHLVLNVKKLQSRQLAAEIA